MSAYLLPLGPLATRGVEEYGALLLEGPGVWIEGVRGDQTQDLRTRDQVKGCHGNKLPWL